MLFVGAICPKGLARILRVPICEADTGATPRRRESPLPESLFVADINIIHISNEYMTSEAKRGMAIDKFIG